MELYAKVAYEDAEKVLIKSNHNLDSIDKRIGFER